MYRRSFIATALAFLFAPFARPVRARPAPLKAWRINEYDVYAGTTIEEAIAAAMKDSGCGRDEVLDASMYGIEEPRSAKVRLDTEEESYTTIGEMLDEMDGPGMVCGYDC